MRRFVHRHQEAISTAAWIKAGVGSLLALGWIGWLGQETGSPFLIGPFGATIALLFGLPDSALAQPANVMGGYVVATLAGLLLQALLPGHWWMVAIAVSLGLLGMAALRVLHPPAGAIPILVASENPDWTYLFLPVLAGAAMLVLIAVAVHRCPPRGTAYPRPLPEAIE
ncbi:MAG: HPP family protein [Magnetospirillum sp. WYHS-4]